MLHLRNVLRLGLFNRSYSSNYLTLTSVSQDSIRRFNSTSSGKSNSGLVAAAFAHLNTEEASLPKNQPSPKSSKINKVLQVEQQINSAEDINTLLSIAEAPIVSRKNALKVVSKLSDWSTANKVKLSDFETDQRFLKLCRILGRNRQGNVLTTMTRSDDLTTVLSITGEDEAARLITDLTLPQMVKVMSALAKKGSRSTPILQAIAFNVSRQGDTLNLKQSADLLFSMALLNFPDPVLMERICNDIQSSLSSNEDRNSVITSILRSMGIMKYKDVDLLNSLTDWMVDHSDLFPPEDIATAAVTAGSLAWLPENEKFLKLVLKLKDVELSKPSTWLNLVFSLSILDKVTAEHVNSVLQKDFLEKLSAFYKFELPVTVRRKLLNLDAYAGNVLQSYSGARLPNEIAQNIPLLHTKEKQAFVQSIHDTFKSLVSSESFLKRDCDSGMGFLYDAEFVVDSKCHPIALNKATKEHHRVAVMALDYHDFCRNKLDPLGYNRLFINLLQSKGMKVLNIPYTEYNPRDKLITRVQYIEKRLKEIITPTNV